MSVAFGHRARVGRMPPPPMIRCSFSTRPGGDLRGSRPVIDAPCTRAAAFQSLTEESWLTAVDCEKLQGDSGDGEALDPETNEPPQDSAGHNPSGTPCGSLVSCPEDNPSLIASTPRVAARLRERGCPPSAVCRATPGERESEPGTRRSAQGGPGAELGWPTQLRRAPRQGTARTRPGGPKP